MGKKKMYLTPDEQKLIKLYRSCESAQLYLYEAKMQQAKEFTEILANAKVGSKESTIWLASESGKIEATAFLRSEGNV